MPAPLYLVLEGLPPAVRLLGAKLGETALATGMTQCVDPLGAPFVEVSASMNLGPGQHLTVTLSLANSPHEKRSIGAISLFSGPRTP